MRQFNPKLALTAARKWSIAALFRRTPPAKASTSFRFLARRIGSDLPADSGRVITLSSLADPDTTAETVAMLGWYLHEELARDVLLIDAGFEDAPLSRRFDLEGAEGLTDLLRSNGNPEACAVEVAEGMSLLPAGRSAVRESSDSAGLASLIKKARARWAYVIVQHGPVADDTRYITLGSLADLVLLLAEEGGTRLAEVEAANEIYHQNGIAGVQLLMTGGQTKTADAPEGE